MIAVFSGKSRPPLAAAFATALFLLLAVAAGAQQDEPRVEVKLDPRGDVGLEEIVRLTVEIQSPTRGTGRPVFQLENLRVVGGPSQSTSVQFYNGVSSRTLSYTWMLQAARLGGARVHRLELDTGDAVLELPEQTLQVVENPPARNRGGSQMRDPFGRRGGFPRSPFERRQEQRRRQQAPPPEIFLEAQVEPKRPVVGQQVLYTLYLYTDVNVRSVTPTELPDFKGFWAKPIPQPDNAQPERVIRDGREIGRVVLLERALFPRRAGELAIEPVQATMTALIRDDSLFGSLMPRMGEIDRASNPLTVDVRPLPEAPEGFTGIVGRVGLEARLEPRELEIGEAATLTLTLAGEGHLQGTPAPDLPEIEGIEIFPPQQQSEENLRGKKVRGKRTWNYVLVPERPGVVEIPAVELPYFDPGRRAFRTASVDPMVIQVKGSTRAASTGAGGGGDIELHSIRSAVLPGSVRADSPGLGLWRHGLLLLPWLWLIATWAWRRRRGEGSEAGPGGSPKQLRRRLRTALEAAQQEDDPKRTAAVVETAWREFLADRWEIPAGTPSSRWSPLLEERNVSSQTAEELVRLVEDLHYLRYAPKLSSTVEMRKELLSRSSRLLKKL